MAFSIQVTESAHITGITVNGEVDAYTTPAFAQAVKTSLERGSIHLIIDLENISYIDSCGLGVLVSALKAVAARRGTLRIVAVQEQVRRLLSITGLDRVLTLHASKRDAVDVARQAARKLGVHPFPLAHEVPASGMKSALN